MSWFTAGEIVVWLVLAAVLGLVLGWLLHEVWDRRRARRRPQEAGPGLDRLIKGNASSMIFHRPGSPAYERTRPDVWFVTEREAIAAGFRAPKTPTR